MPELIIEIINSLKKEHLSDFEKLQIQTIFDVYLSVTDVCIEELHLMHIFLNYLDFYLDDIKQNKMLYLKYTETKMKILRLSLNKLDMFKTQPKKIINNLRLTKPTKYIDAINIKDVFLYEDGSIEEQIVFDLHPNYNIDTDSPLLNDYAQYTLNLSEKRSKGV